MVVVTGFQMVLMVLIQGHALRTNLRQTLECKNQAEEEPVKAAKKKKPAR